MRQKHETYTVVLIIQYVFILNLLTHNTAQHTTSHHNSTSSFLNELNYLKTHKQLEQLRTPLDAPP